MAAKGKALRPDVLQALFLEAYEGCGRITAAAKLAGIVKATHYVWLQDPDYASRFAKSGVIATDNLIDEARRRAHDGVEKPILYKGTRCYELKKDPKDKTGQRYVPDMSKPIIMREYSDNLLMFLIKERRPEFRESSKIELSGDLGIVQRLLKGRERLSKREQKQP